MSAQAEAIGADAVFRHGENKETRKSSSKPYLGFGGVKTVRTLLPDTVPRKKNRVC